MAAPGSGGAAYRFAAFTPMVPRVGARFETPRFDTVRRVGGDNTSTASSQYPLTRFSCFTIFAP